MRLPQDLANLLAVAIRDVIWFKHKVCAFLEECNVPDAIMVDVRKMQSQPTIKTIHFVLEALTKRGDEGEYAARAMLTKMFYWKDLHTIPPDKKDQAVASLQALQQAYRRYQEQQSVQRRQERSMDEERIKRQSLRALDHEKLQAFRDEFDAVFKLQDRQERGNGFQDLMNRIFDYYCEQSKGAFRRTGEQIDGLFYFDKHWYLVEVRWKEEKATAADISILRDRAKDAFGGDTKALFISFNGFTDECLKSLKGRGDERVVLMDGYDLRCVLDCQIAFDVLIAEKQGEAVKSKRPFVGAGEIIDRRGAK